MRPESANAGAPSETAEETVAETAAESAETYPLDIQVRPGPTGVDRMPEGLVTTDQGLPLCRDHAPNLQALALPHFFGVRRDGRFMGFVHVDDASSPIRFEPRTSGAGPTQESLGQSLELRASEGRLLLRYSARAETQRANCTQIVQRGDPLYADALRTYLVSQRYTIAEAEDLPFGPGEE
ncbi:MAG: hypothetical protein AB8H86_33340 [Polyangiales bacterium]